MFAGGSPFGDGAAASGNVIEGLIKGGGMAAGGGGFGGNASFDFCAILSGNPPYPFLLEAYHNRKRSVPSKFQEGPFFAKVPLTF